MQPFNSQQLITPEPLLKKSDKADIQKYCVLYLFCWTIAPILAIGMIWRILALAAFAVWYSLALKRGFQITHPMSKAIGFSIFISVVIILTDLKIGHIIKRIDVFMLTIAVLMFHFYIKHPQELIDLIPYLLFMLALFNFRTGKALLSNPHIARLIVRNSDEAHTYQMKGIGGYCLLYLQVCACPAILAWGKQLLLTPYRKKIKILFISWLLSYLLFLFKASYSIALFATAISCYLVLPKKKTNLRQSLVIMIVFFILLMAAILYIEPFRNLLLDIFRGTAIERKLHDFAFINGIETNDRYAAQNYGSFDTRFSAYSGSLWKILKYPIIGGLFFDKAVGSHSAILDTIARFGWLGGWLYCGMIFTIPNTLKKKLPPNTQLSSINNATFAVLLFIALLDTLPFEISFNLVMLNAVFFFDLMKNGKYFAEPAYWNYDTDNSLTNVSNDT